MSAVPIQHTDHPAVVYNPESLKLECVFEIVSNADLMRLHPAFGGKVDLETTTFYSSLAERLLSSLRDRVDDDTERGFEVSIHHVVEEGSSLVVSPDDVRTYLRVGFDVPGGAIHVELTRAVIEAEVAFLSGLESSSGVSDPSLALSCGSSGRAIRENPVKTTVELVPSRVRHLHAVG